MSAEFWQAVLKRPWPLAEVPLNEWKAPQLQLSKLNILVIIYTMFNNTGSSHARRLGLVYGTKIIPNQSKSMIFPQAAPINDLHDMWNSCHQDGCDAASEGTSIMHVLIKDLHLEDFTALGALEPRSSSPPPRPEMSNVSWHVLSRTGYPFFPLQLQKKMCPIPMCLVVSPQGESMCRNRQ